MLRTPGFLGCASRLLNQENRERPTLRESKGVQVNSYRLQTFQERCTQVVGSPPAALLQPSCTCDPWHRHSSTLGALLRIPAPHLTPIGTCQRLQKHSDSSPSTCWHSVAGLKCSWPRYGIESRSFHCCLWLVQKPHNMQELTSQKSSCSSSSWSTNLRAESFHLNRGILSEQPMSCSPAARRVEGSPARAACFRHQVSADQLCCTFATKSYTVVSRKTSVSTVISNQWLGSSWTVQRLSQGRVANSAEKSWDFWTPRCQSISHLLPICL